MTACVTWLEKEQLGTGLEKSTGGVMIGQNFDDLLGHSNRLREVGKLADRLQCQIQGMGSAVQCEQATVPASLNTYTLCNVLMMQHVSMPKLGKQQQTGKTLTALPGFRWRKHCWRRFP